MIGSVFGIVTDVVKVAVMPVEIAADIARAVTKPAADGAKQLASLVKELTKS